MYYTCTQPKRIQMILICKQRNQLKTTNILSITEYILHIICMKTIEMIFIYINMPTMKSVEKINNHVKTLKTELNLHVKYMHKIEYISRCVYICMYIYKCKYINVNICIYMKISKSNENNNSMRT
jgi:hypothetical protein